MASAASPVLFGYDLQKFIAGEAVSLGLDPAAVLAVAQKEGGFGPPPGNIGDGGTSFGPFQLHQGGALPAGVADPATWANTQPGLDYALKQIANVASGKKGTDAISAIVSGFEHPADPAAEIQRASSLYPLFQQEPLVQAALAGAGGESAVTGTGGSTTPTGVGGPTSGSGSGSSSGGGGSVCVCHLHVPGTGICIDPLYASCLAGQAIANTGPVKTVSGAVSSATDAISSVGDALRFIFSYRFLEVLGGGLLVLIGVILLAREIGFKTPAVNVIGQVQENRRRQETHQARLETQRARTEEVNSRAMARRETRRAGGPDSDRRERAARVKERAARLDSSDIPF